MEFRKSTFEDFDDLMDIFSHARKFMAENGNPTQWGNYKPTAEMIKEDITLQRSWMCFENGELVGTFALCPGKDPTYAEIIGDGWSSDCPYAAIHRVAGNGKTHGLFISIVSFCKGRYPYLRVDTHEDNIPMRSSIKKAGFSFCGIIHIADGTPRRAFDYHAQQK